LGILIFALRDKITPLLKYYTSIRVKILEDALPQEVQDRLGVDASRGDVSKLPAWLALLLVKHGVAKPAEAEDIDLPEKLELERVQDILQPLPEDFYSQLRASSPPTGRLKLYLEDLVRARMRKVFRMALSPSISESEERKLTPEERVLFKLAKLLVNIAIQQASGGS